MSMRPAAARMMKTKSVPSKATVNTAIGVSPVNARMIQNHDHSATSPQRIDTQREQAEAEEFVPAGLKQQVQRHHPVGVQSQTEGLGVVRRGRDHRCDEFAVGSQIESGAGEPCLVAPW